MVVDRAELTALPDDVPVVVNCTGLGARSLPRSNDIVVGGTDVDGEWSLEVERVSSGTRVVHCYGHGGAGVTVSWGCADEVVALVDDEGTDE